MAAPNAGVIWRAARPGELAYGHTRTDSLNISIPSADHGTMGCHASKHDSSTLVAPPFGVIRLDAWQREQLKEMERAAPNLVAYHKQTMQVTGELMGAGCAAPFLLARLLEAHNPKLRALARASFEVHDTSRTGTLSREESRTFFDDYVRIAVFINMAVTHHVLATDGGPVLEALKPMMREQLQLLHQRTAPGHRPEGFDGKRRDEAAFGVLDKNGNGQLVEEEVVQALTLGTPQQNQLQLALGIKDDALIKKTIEEMHEQIVAQTIELEQLENVKREAPPLIPPRSPGGTMTLADGTVIHSSVASGV